MFKRRNRAMCLLLAVVMLFSLPTNAAAMLQGTPTAESSQSEAVHEAYENIKALTGSGGLMGFDGENALPEDNTPVSVIVLFNNQPAATVKAAAELEHNVIMSMNAATKIAEADHTNFKTEIAQMFGASKFSVDGVSAAAEAEYEITSEYHNALNGVSLTLPADRVEDLLELDSVYAVYPNAEVRLDTEELNSLSAATTAGNPDGGKGGRDQMNADALHDLGITGEGVDILIIDSGVDYNHPALNPAFMDQSPSGNPADLINGKFYGRNFVDNGYDYVNRAANDPMEATYEEWLNSGEEWILNGYEFSTMHGTHVTGTAVAQDVFDDDSGNGALGVAPDANVYVYRVFGAYSRSLTEFILNAIEYVAIDQPDVVNMSLGTGLNDPYYIYSLAVNNIMIQNEMIVFVIAAGNYGEQGMFSLGSPSTSSTAITVANATAKTVNTEYRINTFRSTNGNPSQTGAPGRFIRPLYLDMDSNLSLQPVAVTNPVSDAVLTQYSNVYVSDYPNLKLHTEGALKGKYKLAIVLDAEITSYGEIGTGTEENFKYTEEKLGADFFEGSIAVIRRGADFSVTAQLAIERGAGAVLMINHSASGIDGDPSGIESFRGRSEDYLPFFVIEYDDWGGTISTWPAPNGNFEIENGFGIILSASREAVLNPGLDASSSRGPVGMTFDIKPDVSAHGANVTSTVPLYNKTLYENEAGYAVAYGAASGTSMASPHVAGAAALLRCAYPEMTAEEIKIRLMNSANIMDMTSWSISAKYSVHEQGAGLVDVLAAYQAEDVVAVKYDNVSVPTLLGDIANYDDISKASRATGSFNFGKMAISEENGMVTKTLDASITNTSANQKQFYLTSQFNTEGSLVLDPNQNYGWDIVSTLQFVYDGTTYESYDAPQVTVPAGQTVEFSVILNVDSNLALQYGLYSGSFEGYVMINDTSWSIVYTLPFAGYSVLDKEPIEHAFLNRPVISSSETSRQTTFSGKADFFLTLNKPAYLNFAIIDPDLYDSSKVVDGQISYEDLTAERWLLGSLETAATMQVIEEGAYYIINDVLDGSYYPFVYEEGYNFPVGVAYPAAGESLPKLKEGLNAILVETYTAEGEVYYYVYEFYVDNTPPTITLTGGDTAGDYGAIPGIVNEDTITLTGTVFDAQANIMAELGLQYEIWEEGDILGSYPDQSFTVLYAEVGGTMYKANVDPVTGAFTVDIPKIALPGNIYLHAVDGFSILSFTDSFGNRSTTVADDFELDRPSCGALLAEEYLSQNYGFVGSNRNSMLVTVGQGTAAAFTLSNDQLTLFAGEQLKLDVLFNSAAIAGNDQLAAVTIANQVLVSAAISGNQITVNGLRNGETTITVTTKNGLSRTFDLFIKAKYNEGVDLSAGVEVYYGAMPHLINYSFAAEDYLALPAPSASGRESEATPIVWTIMGTETLANGSAGDLSLLSKYVLEVKKFTIDGMAIYAERDYTIRHYMNGGVWYTYDPETGIYTPHYVEREESFMKYFTEDELSAVPPVANEAYNIVNGEAYAGSVAYGDKFFLPWVAWHTIGNTIYTSIYWNATASINEKNAILYGQRDHQLENAPEIYTTLKSGIPVPYMTETLLDNTRIQIIPYEGSSWPTFGGTAWMFSGFRPAMTLDVDRIIYAAKDDAGISKLTIVAEEPETIGVITGNLSAETRTIEVGQNFTANAQVTGSGYDNIAYKILNTEGAIVAYEEIASQDITAGTFTFNTAGLAAGEYRIVVWPQDSDDLNSNLAGEPVIFYVTIEEAVRYTVTYKANGGTGADVTDVTELEHTVLAADTFTAPAGMEFDSWNTAAGGTGTTYLPGAELQLDADLTLYAIWRISLISITTPANITDIANGAAATAAGLGLPATIELVTTDGVKVGTVTWDVEGCDYDPANEGEQTFTVTGQVNLPADVQNPNDVSLTVTIQVTVLEKPEDPIVFTGIAQPDAITGLENGTEKTAEALGLPETIMINTTAGSMTVTVTWDVEDCDYDPANEEEQTFTVNGQFTLPAEVENPNEVSLTVTIEVTVLEKPEDSVIIESIDQPSPITGLENGTAKTAQALGLPESIMINTTAGSMEVTVTWDVAGCDYDPANTEEQTFFVKGAFALPEGVENPHELLLEVAIRVTVEAAVPAPVTYTIRFEANGGTVNPETMETDTAGRLASLPTPVRNSYRFDGWFTEKSGGVEVTKATVFEKDTTVYAQWTYSGSGGGVVENPDPTDPKDPEPTDPNPTEPTDPVPPAMDEERITTPEDEPAIIGEDGTITLPGGGQLQLTENVVVDVSAGTVIDADGSITIGSEGATMMAGSMTLSLKPGTVIILDETSALGYYVSFVNPFTDVSQENWFYSNVGFAASHSLFEGTGNNQFSPNTAMTRGMLATVLARLDGADLSVYQAGSFGDVAAGQWYAESVEWAADMGIAQGDGTNFMPNSAITREQLAVMLYNYASATGYDLPAGTTGAFADSGSVHSWAEEAVAALQAAGIINGRPGNLFDPQGGATRAEVAAMLERFIEYVAG